MQHLSFDGSQTEPLVNLHVVGLQQLFPWQPCSPPQSHSSPVSTIPFPQTPSDIVGTSSFPRRQLVWMRFRPIAVQMVPMVQGENTLIARLEVGFIMYWPVASQLLWLNGQQRSPPLAVLPEQPVVQSWTAPKLCPISCAITCHSAGVLTTTLAEGVDLLRPESLHTVPIQAIPTVEAELQEVSNVQTAFTPSLDCALHVEKDWSRSPMLVVELHWTFQGVDVDVVEGQSRSLIVRFRTLREMLKLSS